MGKPLPKPEPFLRDESSKYFEDRCKENPFYFLGSVTSNLVDSFVKVKNSIKYNIKHNIKLWD